jgi:replicative DNA helicase
MEWAIAKNRDGPTGRIPMVFVRSRGTFMSEHQYEGA